MSADPKKVSEAKACAEGSCHCLMHNQNCMTAVSKVLSQALEEAEARLNRVLLCKDITLTINKYGPGAAGNSVVSIEDIEDIDVVLKQEAEAREKN